MSKTWVKITMAALFLGILGWDAWLYFDDVPGNTITQIFREAASQYVYVTVLFSLFIGWLIGHFFG